MNKRTSRKRAVPARARGDGFFAAAETLPYQPRGSLLGQMTPDSCVAACCRMLLCDYAADVAESYLRAALATDDEGSFVSQAPAVLRECRLPLRYSYRSDLTVAELRKAVQSGPAIASVLFTDERSWHALLIDNVDEDAVLIRDPLPWGIGAAYRVALPVFMRFWLSERSGYGQAAIVVK